MDTSYKDFYQKLWLARVAFDASWDGAKHRLHSEDPVYMIMTPEDHQHPAWLQYTLLQGRSTAFFAFIQAQLGIGETNMQDKLQEYWNVWATPRFRAYITTSLDNKKLVRWPLTVEIEGGK